MKIGVRASRGEFISDLHPLVRSFFPGAEIRVFEKGDPDVREDGFDRVIGVEIPGFAENDPASRGAAREEMKRELYRRLSKETGVVLPWGTLIGVRPTKIPVRMLEKGCAEDEIRRTIRKEYLTSDEKIELAIEVAKREMRLLENSGDGYNLYVGVPFCPSICLYCTFSSSLYGQYRDRVGEYLDCLEKELASIAKMADRPLHTVYVGGGTPTSLSAGELCRLLDMIGERFPPRSAREYTVEAGRPDSVTAGKLSVMKDHGVTRISVNPQTMNQKTLDLIGRRHTVEETREAFYLAREAGFDNINMDIILGLPDETEEDIRRTAEEIEKLGPDALTVHSLAVKRSSRLNLKAEDYGDCIFRNDREIMRIAHDGARAMGMEPYYLYRQKNMKGNLENTGFARPGKECLYNILIMEEAEPILAAGAGASSKFIGPDGFISRTINPKNVETYLENTDELIEKKRKAYYESRLSQKRTDR